MKTVYTISEDLFTLDLDAIKVGDQYILVSYTDTMTGGEWFRLVPDNGAGIGGNMDRHIKRYHGWRGTSNDVSCYAEGLRRVERVDPVQGDRDNRTVKVKLSADLVPDLP